MFHTHITDRMTDALVEQAHAIEADIAKATGADDFRAVLSHLDILRRQIGVLRDANAMELEERRQVAEKLQGPIDG
jgi:choline dehydrogenase-like flavoprotein